ncbi:hypothetical protein KUF83_30375 [Streptomyces sp. BV286]|uniref:hypothetical protein n=1 Tax=Streptomyces sp. BV286 TaxID=2849672 RepID=UPI001C2EA803|nr:hypothetical protein [Streptomyces sp. BV286]MBV1940843.1 hypothetical protein [Streptomyces sp. BV286]
MNYLMTEEYAGTMSTVIPVIMLAGAVEVAVLNQKWQQGSHLLLRAFTGEGPEITRDERESMRGMFMLGIVWIGLCVASFVAETGLILWLVGDERSPSPILALFTAWVSILGFSVVTLGGFALAIRRLVMTLLTPLRRTERQQRPGQDQT